MAHQQVFTDVTHAVEDCEGHWATAAADTTWHSRLLRLCTPDLGCDSGWPGQYGFSIHLTGAWIADATGARPTRFAPNGSPHHVRRALTAAVHAGDDTDTVAAIAGGLLGARCGASAVPAEWASAVHGWPGMVADDVTELSLRTAREGA